MKSSLSVEDQRLFFKKNRGDLVSRVKNVKAILDDLQSAGLHDEMAANVDADKIPQEGMRRIINSATSSVAVKALFTALLKHENGVMMDLLGKKSTNSGKCMTIITKHTLTTTSALYILNPLRPGTHLCHFFI